jgi:hypothetical protein
VQAHLGELPEVRLRFIERHLLHALQRGILPGFGQLLLLPFGHQQLQALQYSSGVLDVRSRLRPRQRLLPLQ